MKEKWLGARMTAPLPGTLSTEIGRARSSVYAYSEVITRTSSYTQSGSRSRERA